MSVLAFVIPKYHILVAIGVRNIVDKLTGGLLLLHISLVNSLSTYSPLHNLIECLHSCSLSESGFE